MHSSTSDIRGKNITPTKWGEKKEKEGRRIILTIHCLAIQKSLESLVKSKASFQLLLFMSIKELRAIADGTTEKGYWVETPNPANLMKFLPLASVGSNLLNFTDIYHDCPERFWVSEDGSAQADPEIFY